MNGDQPNPTPSGPVQRDPDFCRHGTPGCHPCQQCDEEPAPPQPVPKPESDEWFEALGDEIEKHPITGPPKPATAPGSGLWTDSKPLNLGEEDSWRPRDDGGWETEAEDGRTQIWTPTEGYNFGTGPWAQPAQAPAPGRHEASRAAFEDAFWKRKEPDELRATAYEMWCRALDHAAQEQPAPDGSAVEWVKTETEHFGMGHSGRALRECAALELAQRCDAAEAAHQGSININRDLVQVCKTWKEMYAERGTKLAAAERTVERLLKAIQDEPELPGDMPEGVWVSLQGFSYSQMQAFLRGSVRKIKENILARAALAATKEAPTPKRPTIVCLVGSSRFYKEYQEAEYRETMAGKIYLSIGFYPHAAAEMHGEGVGHDSVEKVALDELHKRKIELADEVLVLNVGGYIGDSTRSEIAHAVKIRKPVRWLEAETKEDASNE